MVLKQPHFMPLLILKEEKRGDSDIKESPPGWIAKQDSAAIGGLLAWLGCFELSRVGSCEISSSFISCRWC